MPTTANQGKRNPAAGARLRSRTKAWLAWLVVAVLLAVSASGAAQSRSACRQDGMNMQCNQFGSIKMPTQHDIKGDPALVEVTTTLQQTYEESGARWVMFSVRHDPQGGSSPVYLSLVKLESPHGELFTSRIDNDRPNEINLWVHVVDVPVGVPITLQVEAGSADRGAFQLEALVMAFDRGYEPIKDASGEDRTLFSFTLLGVNEASGSGGSGGGALPDRLRIPAPPLVAVTVALVALALALRRRQA